MAKKTRAVKVAAEDIEVKERRDRELSVIRLAIQEDRAYLDTAWGIRKVVGYNDETGECHTNNRGDYSDDRTFLICRDRIQINPTPGESERVAY